MGWKDRFSSAQNSQRQQEYSTKLGSQVYTPQLVINGKTEFVGSDRKMVENTISNELNGLNDNKIELKAKILPKEINFNYTISQATSKDKLLITFVQKQASTQVGGGENEGRHLQHFQIVQKQYPVILNSKEGTATFPIPNNFNSNDWEVIGLVQNIRSGEIVASIKAIFN